MEELGSRICGHSHMVMYTSPQPPAAANCGHSSSAGPPPVLLSPITDPPSLFPCPLIPGDLPKDTCPQPIRSTGQLASCPSSQSDAKGWSSAFPLDTVSQPRLSEVKIGKVGVGGNISPGKKRCFLSCCILCACKREWLGDKMETQSGLQVMERWRQQQHHQQHYECGWREKQETEWGSSVGLQLRWKTWLSALWWAVTVRHTRSLLLPSGWYHWEYGGQGGEGATQGMDHNVKPLWFFQLWAAVSHLIHSAPTRYRPAYVFEVAMRAVGGLSPSQPFRR